MYSGIIQELGEIVEIEPIGGGVELTVKCSKVIAGAELGDSLGVNGVCLTVTATGPDWWKAHAQVETLDRTSLGALRKGALVNLEKPLTLDALVGGHLVQGHVDGTGKLIDRDEQDDGSVRMMFELDDSLMKYIVEKGSVAVDGISLTVASRGIDWFDVALIPFTLQNTNLGAAAIGHIANIEVDLIAKYVQSLLGAAPSDA